MDKRKNDFDEFMKDVAKDSAEVGERAAFEAYGEHFRLALEPIKSRRPARPHYLRGFQRLSFMPSLRRADCSFAGPWPITSTVQPG